MLFDRYESEQTKSIKLKVVYELELIVCYDVLHKNYDKPLSSHSNLEINTYNFIYIKLILQLSFKLRQPSEG